MLLDLAHLFWELSVKQPESQAMGKFAQIIYCII